MDRMNFDLSGRDKKNQRVRVTVRASSLVEAIAKMKQRGIIVDAQAATQDDSLTANSHPGDGVPPSGKAKAQLAKVRSADRRAAEDRKFKILLTVVATGFVGTGLAMVLFFTFGADKSTAKRGDQPSAGPGAATVLATPSSTGNAPTPNSGGASGSPPVLSPVPTAAPLPSATTTPPRAAPTPSPIAKPAPAPTPKPISIPTPTATLPSKPAPPKPEAAQPQSPPPEMPTTLAAGIEAGRVEAPTAEARRIVFAAMDKLKENHVSSSTFTDEMGAAALEHFIDSLDPSKMYFTHSDWKEFQGLKGGVSAQLRLGNAASAFVVYRRFQERVAERSRMWRTLLSTHVPDDFESDEYLIIKPGAVDYLDDLRPLYDRWRRHLKYQLLRFHTGQGGDRMEGRAAAMRILKRYDQHAEVTRKTKPLEVLEWFLVQVSRQFDYNSTYMAPLSAETDQKTRTGELYGIGAQLKEDGGLTVNNLVTGGSAARDGRLKTGDRIVSIGQGDSGPMIDTDGMSMNEAVSLIRGPTGTAVRLGVIPAARNEFVTYSLKRSKIVLPQAVIERRLLMHGANASGEPYKIGYLHLPTFYEHSAGSDSKSSTNDLRRELDRLSTDGAELLVLDLRDNGGGPLKEAISAPGLFLDGESIMQARNRDKSFVPYHNTGGQRQWTKPLVVLVNKRTGGAAEIFCAAIQDHRRGLVVGDEFTAGAGTVHTLLELSTSSFTSSELGTVQVTTQQFFRPGGDAVHERGVFPDVVLPSAAERNDRIVTKGNAIVFERVTPMTINNNRMTSSATSRSLQKQSYARRKRSDDFRKLGISINRIRRDQMQLVVPLNKQTFLEQVHSADSGSTVDAAAGARDFYLDEVLTIATDYLQILAGEDSPLRQTPEATDQPLASGPTEEQLENGEAKILAAMTADAGIAEIEDAAERMQLKAYAEKARRILVGNIIEDLFNSLSPSQRAIAARIASKHLENRSGPRTEADVMLAVDDELGAADPGFKSLPELGQFIAKAVLTVRHGQP